MSSPWRRKRPNKYSVKTWMSFVTSSYSAQVAQMLTPVIFFMGFYSTLFCYLFIDFFKLRDQDISGTMMIHSLLGIVLGLFLVFRMNSAYDRWWEGRIQWGLMVNNTRNLAHKINAILKKSDISTRRWFSRMIFNLVFSTKEHLRDHFAKEDMLPPDSEFSQRIKGIEHLPNRISSMLYERVIQLHAEKKMSDAQLYIIDKELKQFSDIIGACERIKNTPIPYSYTMYIKKFIFLYLITLPFGFVTVIGYMTILAMLMVSYILLGIELIAEEIEEPFGLDINDLPTDVLADKIRHNVEEILEAPAALPRSGKGADKHHEVRVTL